MSLPLRPALENVSSVDRVLEDLLVRFIINCPPEDLSSVERELFHFEEASWFYTDFVKLMNPTLPSLRIKSFAQHVIKLCPLVWKWDIKADEALQKFSKYKKSIPVRGAAIFNQKLSKILLVQGTESDSWSFPRGKISKDEDDVACCIREVKEEIGFDLTDYIDENQFIERNIQGKNYKIFIVKGVPEDFPFKPQVRNEIDKIEWRDFKKMSKTMYKSNVKYYLINSMMRPLSMWLRRQRHVKNDDQLKQYAEEQLKLLLGITKEEQLDPGRDLLNMLHTAVQSKDEKIEPLQTLQNETVARNPMMAVSPPDSNGNTVHHPIPYPQNFAPLVGFQPFAPFPYVNGNLPFMNPQLVPSGVPQLPPMAHPNGFISMANSEINPSTPDASSLAKPVLAQEQSDLNSSTSKQLLDLLHTKKSDSSTPRVSQRPIEQNLQNLSVDDKQSLHRDNHGANYSDSQSLLNILKNPKQQDLHEAGSRMQPFMSNERKGEEEASLQDELSDGAYEAFESASEDDSGKTNQERDGDDDYESYEDFESSSEEEEEEQKEEKQVAELQRGEEPPIGITNHEALKENVFKGGDIPHIEERTDSVKSVDGTQAPTEKVKPKPKFKLLKRGETLDNILPDQKTSEQPHKTPQNEANAFQAPNTLLELLKKPHDNVNESGVPNSGDSVSERKISPEEELMGMIRKNQNSLSNPESIAAEPQNPSAHILNILMNPRNPSGSETSPNMDFATSPRTVNNVNEKLNDSQSASADLLGLLKRPTMPDPVPRYEDVNVSSPSHQTFNDPFGPGGPKQPASNELLNILHGKR